MAGKKRSREREHVQRQNVFGFVNWGGRRKGAGRKPKGGRPLVSHRRRETFASVHPVHVTMRVRAGLQNLRAPPARRALERAFAGGCERFGFRLVHYSIQVSHLHLIAEAEDRCSHARGVQGLAVRIAKALNKLWLRKGEVFADRYHDRVLRTPREVRNALVYVLRNHVKHGIAIVGLDPCSSGKWFDGWEVTRIAREAAAHVARAKSWLLDVGWRKGGLLGAQEAPRTSSGSSPRASASR